MSITLNLPQPPHHRPLDAPAASVTPVAAAAAAEAGVWWVYQSADAVGNHGSWSNIVPERGFDVLRIDPADRTSPQAAGGTAVRLVFDFGRGPWAGVVVASEPGYWGDRPGPGFDLARYRVLAFRARGLAGGESIRVKAAVAGDQPFGDQAALPVDAGWITLGSDWREYRIDTDGRDLSRVVTSFMVVANDKHNPSGRATVFLADIRWETGR